MDYASLSSSSYPLSERTNFIKRSKRAPSKSRYDDNHQIEGHLELIIRANIQTWEDEYGNVEHEVEKYPSINATSHYVKQKQNNVTQNGIVNKGFPELRFMPMCHHITLIGFCFRRGGGEGVSLTYV